MRIVNENRNGRVCVCLHIGRTINICGSIIDSHFPAQNKQLDMHSEAGKGNLFLHIGIRTHVCTCEWL